MPRASWRGLLRLSLVSCPIYLSPATTRVKSIRVHQVWLIRNCRTPMLVLPDDVPGHPLQTSIDVASLAPNAEITVYPWKEPEELRQRTIDRVRRFLKAHIPMRAAAQ
jgi:hypothetical protein